MNTAKSKQGLPLRTIHIIIGATIFVFFALMFLMSLSLRQTAAEVPLLVTGAGMFFSVIELFYLARETAPKEDAEPDTGLRWYYSLAIVATYICILMTLGFVASTLIYLFWCPVILGYRKWMVNAVFSLVSTAVLYYGFVDLFLVKLPEGILVSMWLGR
jgi:putative tricarboxylic transport membrane protein